jgi:rubrerythrin
MPPKPLGDRPLTNAEKQKRHRLLERERRLLAEEAVAFVLALRLDAVPPTPRRALAALQRRLREPLLCASCGKFQRDPPSRLCPGCEAYQEHQR